MLFTGRLGLPAAPRETLLRRRRPTATSVPVHLNRVALLPWRGEGDGDDGGGWLAVRKLSMGLLIGRRRNCRTRKGETFSNLVKPIVESSEREIAFRGKHSPGFSTRMRTPRVTGIMLIALRGGVR